MGLRYYFVFYNEECGIKHRITKLRTWYRTATDCGAKIGDKFGRARETSLPVERSVTGNDVSRAKELGQGRSVVV